MFASDHEQDPELAQMPRAMMAKKLAQLRRGKTRERLGF
jgi:hypothetical protein